MQPRYRRALLKLSGESLKGTLTQGIDPDAVRYVAEQIRDAIQLGVKLGIVVGGGNIWRGQEAARWGMDRATADYAGMLATLINSLTLQDALERIGVDTRTQTALPVQSVAEPYIRRRALRHLEKDRVVIFASGTGNPFMTTDTASALRATEIEAELLLMAKNRVNGVFTADPHKHPEAQKFNHLSYIEAFNLQLNVMDGTALSLCMDQGLPIQVFDLFIPNNLTSILNGSPIGTKIDGQESEHQL